jgi:hypothetical protein
MKHILKTRIAAIQYIIRFYKITRDFTAMRPTLEECIDVGNKRLIAGESWITVEEFEKYLLLM